MKGAELASNIKFYLDYSKYNETIGRMETYSESVTRVMDMHRLKFQQHFKNKRFKELFEFTETLYNDEIISGSQRAFQFGGEPILKHNAKMFNCLNSYADRVEFFKECSYWLLCGCGVGFSVQTKHIKKLPPIIQRDNISEIFIIKDSIEGWADAFGVLVSSFTYSDTKFEKYWGKKILFDYSLIRAKGSLISGGFKAPGSDGLKMSIEKIELLFEKELLNKEIQEFRSDIAYDFVMHMSDAVLSGGVRRSATICLFSFEDKIMMNAKTGNWFSENPQRARSNNSVVLLKSQIKKEEYDTIFKSIEEFGEPGFYLVDDEDQGTNPCVEIGLWPQTIDGVTGWQGCNLSTINGSKINSREKFLQACIAVSFIGTLQASYTDFKYVPSVCKEIFDREALLGCSITGWMSNPDILLNEKNMQDGALLILEINKEVASIIGINPAARTTCTKPEGNSSVLLKTLSGVHGDHDEMYFRLMQINKEKEITKYLKDNVPELLEESIWSRGQTDEIVFCPIISKKGTILKKNLIGIKLLEKVKLIQQNWVKYGKDESLCIKPFLTHNVSNTVDVDNWEEVRDYLWENKEFFSGVSFLPITGDRTYYQAPFTSVKNVEQIIEEYGNAALLISGLIVDGLHVFENIYDACNFVEKRNQELIGDRRKILLQTDWIRRVKQFSKRYFKSDLEKTILCIKDIYWFHKWLNINRILSQKELDFSKIDISPSYTDVNTLGAIACAGGSCEVLF